jgi:hypothetical protein
MRYVFVLPLLLLTSPALAQGFSEADLKASAAANTLQTLSIRKELATEVERLRLAFAYDPKLALSSRVDSERQELFTALGLGEGIADARVRWFMAGAIQQPGYGTTTALFNPLARGWLLLTWKEMPEGWVVHSAWMASSGPADWMSAGGPSLPALLADYADARLRLGQRPAREVGEIIDRWIGKLALSTRDTERNAGFEATRKLIVGGKTARLGGNLVDLLPERARATFWPTASIDREGEAHTVLFGSAVLPSLVIAADFDEGSKLTRVSLIDFENGGKVQ